jgi:conjugal transfer mating pair stabilization protein TraN
MNLRRFIAAFTSAAMLITQTASLAGPHDEGLAAGTAANPVARGSVTTPSARSVVPGYAASAPQSSHYRQPNLAAQGSASLAACAATPNEPVCAALRGAMASANTARPAITAADPAVMAARDITRSPSSVLEGLASYYSGCAITSNTVPASVQSRTCLRYQGIGNLGCSRTLSVEVQRTTSCQPGEWFAHAESGSTGLDVQCQPDRPPAIQRFRLTQDQLPLTYFNADMTSAVASPELVAVTATNSSLGSPGTLIRTGVWITERGCTGNQCALTAIVAEEQRELCANGNEGTFTCTSEPLFIKVHAACPVGQQRGGNIQHSVCNADNGCTTTVFDDSKCYAPGGASGALLGLDITGEFSDATWNPGVDRPVTAWQLNPAYGPIPTMRLSYTRATTEVATIDRWDDQCPALGAGSRCTTASAPACTDGPGTKIVDGVPVTRDCWSYTTTMSCASSAATLDQCAPLAAAGCTPRATSCRQANAATGACEIFEDTYSCPVPAQTATGASNCPSNVFCLEGNCFNIGSAPDADFARSMTLLEASREAAVYIDTDRMQVFRGEENRCRERLLKNCCNTDGGGAGMSNQSVFGSGSRLVYDILTNSDNQQFVYQGMVALLTGAGFSGSFTAYGITVAVNGAAIPAGSVAVYSSQTMIVAFDPWTLVIAVIIYIIVSQLSCNEYEARLALKEGAKLCHTVGTYCSTCLRILGSCASCTEQTTSKCCFNSMLARIINEQGRAQIGKGWGNETAPDCSGFTVAQLQSLNFAAMDLSEFYASLVPTTPNVGALQGNSAGRIPTCYYGQGRCK